MINDQFNIPILFLIFNRPDTTRVVFERIKEIKPKYLYIAADGPRNNNAVDNQLCQETRNNVLKSIDWDCEVKTLFRDKNLGCGRAVSQAISWFFDNVEMGIIIEDDCLPSYTFFSYCEKLLNYYIHESQIMMISGYNISNISDWTNDSYLFSNFGMVWGWASWKRAWLYYDFDIANWKKQNIKNLLRQNYFNNSQFKVRAKLYDKLYNKDIDTWDYQWTFCKLINSGLSIIPSQNLVENIGFHSEATHTFSVAPIWAKMKAHEMNCNFEKLDYVMVDKKYDHIHSYHAFPSKYRKIFSLIKNLIK